MAREDDAARVCRYTGTLEQTVRGLVEGPARYTSAKLTCTPAFSSRYFLKKSEPKICHADLGRRGIPPGALGWRMRGTAPVRFNLWLGLPRAVSFFNFFSAF